jgi:hypothetical protein
MMLADIVYKRVLLEWLLIFLKQISLQLEFRVPRYSNRRFLNIIEICQPTFLSSKLTRLAQDVMVQVTSIRRRRQTGECVNSVLESTELISVNLIIQL